MLKKETVSCNHCQAAEFCLPVGINPIDMSRLEHLVKRRFTLKKGAHLFRQSDPFSAVYAIQSGSFKSYSDTSDGREQIRGFYFLGELLGVEAMGTKVFPFSAQALEESQVCEVPYEALLTLSADIPELQRRVFHLMGESASMGGNVALNASATERLARFLLTLSSRLKCRGSDSLVITLPMTRQEIGNYLGLAIETVSRLFSSFQESGVLVVNGRTISLLKLRELQRLACQ